MAAGMAAVLLIVQALESMIFPKTSMRAEGRSFDLSLMKKIILHGQGKNTHVALNEQKKKDASSPLICSFGLQNATLRHAVYLICHTCIVLTNRLPSKK